MYGTYSVPEIDLKLMLLIIPAPTSCLLVRGEDLVVRTGWELGGALASLEYLSSSRFVLEKEIYIQIISGKV